jgi:peptidoglycan/xylan/chitin deacetylase (PgdA/CDA1 family)
LPHDVRCKVLDDMALWAGAALLARPTHRVLSLEEVDALNQGDLIEIGAHTVTHPFLSAFPPSRQAEEIQQSKGYLENILGQPITMFSYPHGDFTTDTISLITEAGFACACTVVAESVWSHSARYQLPRFEVQNWNGEEFARRLLRWFHN